MIKKIVNILKKSHPVLALQKLIYLGLTGNMKEEDSKRAIILNTLNFTLGTLIILVGSIFCVLSQRLSIIIPCFLELAVVVLSIYMNCSRHYDRAALITYYGQCVFILYFGLLLHALIELPSMIVWLVSILYLIFKNSKSRQLGFIAAVLTMSVLEIARYFPSIFEPIEVSFYTQVIFRSTALLGVVFLIFFVSRPYVASNDSNPELKRMNAELERANNFKRHFVTQVSHEARQPQNAVFAEAQYLKKLIKINPQLSIIAKHVDTLLQANTDSLEIINNILSMSEIEQGNVKSNPNTVFSLRDLIESNIKTNRRVGMLRQVRMKLSKIENIPEAIKGDRLMLKQILNNLFGNAIKYSYPNTTIGVSVKAEGRKFQIQVRNSGPTIEKENFEKIFDPYMMEGKVSTGNLASNGLGLFLVKNWVKIMEGNIFVESENEITTFSIDLPLIAGNVDEIVIENAVKAEYDLSRIHVYIAEDNHMSAASMVNHLTFEGCEVKSFLDGELLIKDLENGIPDIIILDWQMPVRDGKSTLRYLKNDERFSNIPVVVATADVFTESIQAIMDAGANAYLIKPINFELLFETVRQQLQSVDSELQE